MSRPLSIITLLLALVTFFLHADPSQAEDTYDKNIPADSNIGNYIYEDKEYLTQSEVDKINQMNKKLGPQENITLVIINEIPIESDPSATIPISDEEKRQYYINTLTDKFKESDYEKENFTDDKFYSDLSMGRNFLIYSIKDKKLYWEPSSGTNQYLTDYKFWKIKFWYEPALHSFDKQHRIDMVLKLTEKMGQEVKPFTKGSYEPKESSSFEDINNKIDGIKYFFKAIFLLFLFGLFLSIIFAFISVPVALPSVLRIIMFDKKR